ncbi:zinc metalloprotease [Zavarzinella formosa]|uniref:hypothetical protein n=1 Tax=Zavarzinella formosa TaxID=360055 RepID=UPI0002F1EDA3|nr:hypothetical protein [Zavarzinella formosa]
MAQSAYNDVDHPRLKGFFVYEEQAPPRQAGELRWTVFGISYRILPSFWLISALLAYVFIGPNVGGIAVDVACIFVAIVFTTLVQGIVYRSYGLYSTVVIQEFGGGVIPEAEPPTALQRIIVALASPFSCFLLYAVVYYSNQEFKWAVASPPYSQFAYFILCVVGLFWGIIGLLPIYPYPGGRVMLEVFGYFSPVKGLIATLIMSIIVGVAYVAYVGAVVFAKVMPEIPIYDKITLPASIFVGVFFAIATIRNVQLLNIVRAQRRQYRANEYVDDAPWDNR